MPGDARALEAYAEINDFLLLAVHSGVVDAIVYVEPPWSNQFRCCLYDTNATFEFVVGVDDRNNLRVDVAGETPRKFAREHFGHVFWRDGERRTGHVAKLRRGVPFTMSVIAAEHGSLTEVLRGWVDPAKPLILDVDLAFFATESPGAVDIRQRYGLKYDELETLYHLAWNFPRLDAAYFRLGDATRRDAADATDYAQRVTRKVGGFVDVAAKKRSAFAAAFERALGARNLEPWRLRALTDYAARLDVPDAAIGGEAQRDLEYFLEQPFHVPTLGPRYDADLGHLVDVVLKPALAALPTPVLVTVVRSPGYAPGTHLHDTECRVLQLLSSAYHTLAITHEDRVDAKRTYCARIPGYQFDTVPDN